MSINVELDRELQLPESFYTSLFDQNTYHQVGYNVRCSSKLIKSRSNYFETVKKIPPGYRISILDEVRYLIQLSERIKARGGNPRDSLRDSLFARIVIDFMSISPETPHEELYELLDRKIERTSVALRAPRGCRNFRQYKESDPQGRHYYRGDYVIGDKVILEGIWIPKGGVLGGKVVEWNEALAIPAVVSEGEEPQSIAEFYFSPNLKEVSIELDTCWNYDPQDEFGVKLGFVAVFNRRNAFDAHTYRLFEGTLEEAATPTRE